MKQPLDDKQEISLEIVCFLVFYKNLLTLGGPLGCCADVDTQLKKKRLTRLGARPKVISSCIFLFNILFGLDRKREILKDDSHHITSIFVFKFCLIMMDVMINSKNGH